MIGILQFAQLVFSIISIYELLTNVSPFVGMYLSAFSFVLMGIVHIIKRLEAK